MSKKTLGQFYTTKSDYILQGFVIPPTVISVIEPFVGNGDLLPWIGSIPCMELYDIDPKIPEASKRDTLKNRPLQVFFEDFDIRTSDRRYHHHSSEFLFFYQKNRYRIEKRFLKCFQHSQNKRF